MFGVFMDVPFESIDAQVLLITQLRLLATAGMCSSGSRRRARRP
jgi:hypothetical protein